MFQQPVSAGKGGWRFDHSYARLPEALFRRVDPVPVREPGMYLFNPRLAGELGLDAEWLARPEQAGLFTGNAAPAGACFLAQAYAGHQFGHFTNLGDGRALLVGEHITPRNLRVDIQFKGSGQTPFSRRGDGRAALGPMLREYVISEAMHGLGIPTTRSLAVATTGEPVFREEPLPGAVLTRVAASHIRVGTFELASALGEPELLTTLADYTMARHFPACAEADEPYHALLDEVVERQARLIAQWILVGFIHGVMNTDNVALSGETIDYGPCAFMDAYDPGAVFSSIDQRGRYAYGRQPAIGQWNLSRFASCLLPLLDENEEAALAKAQASIDRFGEIFHRAWASGMRAKLGLSREEPGDDAMIEALLRLMREDGLDYTNTFVALCAGRAPGPRPEVQAWFEGWQARVGREDRSPEATRAFMERCNPAVIPRNHRVEEALEAAWRNGDKGPLERLLEALNEPYNHAKPRAIYQQPPPPGLPPYRTFCGT